MKTAGKILAAVAVPLMFIGFVWFIYQLVEGEIESDCHRAFESEEVGGYCASWVDGQMDRCVAELRQGDTASIQPGGDMAAKAECRRELILEFGDRRGVRPIEVPRGAHKPGHEPPPGPGDSQTDQPPAPDAPPGTDQHRDDPAPHFDEPH